MYENAALILAVPMQKCNLNVKLEFYSQICSFDIDAFATFPSLKSTKYTFTKRHCLWLHMPEQGGQSQADAANKKQEGGFHLVFSQPLFLGLCS